MATLLKKTKKNKTYYYIVEEKRIDGKLQRDYVESLGDITRAEAKLKLANYLVNNPTGKRLRKKLTFKKAYADFSAYYKNLVGQTISAGTYKIFTDHCSNLTEFFEDTEVREISFQEIEALKIWLKEKGLSNRFINMHLTELKKILEYCENMEWIIAVPKIKRLPEKGAGKTIDFLKDNEIITLLDHANEQQRFYLLLMIYTGMRPYEATRLRWENVDLERGVIAIESDNRLKLGRQLPLHPRLKDILLNWLRTDEYVSPYRKTSYAMRAMMRLEARVKLHTEGKLEIKCNPYKLRKTFGSILARMNVTHFKTAALMGHRNIQTTYQYYIGLEDTDLAKSIGQIQLSDAKED